MIQPQCLEVAYRILLTRMAYEMAGARMWSELQHGACGGIQLARRDFNS